MFRSDQMIRKLILALLYIFILLGLSYSLANAQTSRQVRWQFSWTDNSNNETHFNLWLKGGDEAYSKVAEFPKDATSGELLTTGTEGQQSCFALTAVNRISETEFYESPRSNDACGTIPFIIPSTPGNFVIKVTVEVVASP